MKKSKIDNMVLLTMRAESVGATNRGERIEVDRISNGKKVTDTNYSVPKTVGLKTKYSSVEELEADLVDPTKSKIRMSSQCVSFYAMGDGIDGSNLKQSEQDKIVLSGTGILFSLREWFSGSLITVKDGITQKRVRSGYMTELVQVEDGALVSDFKTNAASVRAEENTSIVKTINPLTTKKTKLAGELAFDFDRMSVVEMDSRNNRTATHLGLLNIQYGLENGNPAALVLLAECLESALNGKDVNESEKLPEFFKDIKQYVNEMSRLIRENVDKSLLGKSKVSYGEFRKIGSPKAKDGYFGLNLSEDSVKVLLAYFLKTVLTSKHMNTHGYWKMTDLEIDGGKTLLRSATDLEIAEMVMSIDVANNFEKEEVDITQEITQNQNSALSILEEKKKKAAKKDSESDVSEEKPKEKTKSEKKPSVKKKK